ncbi:uncharacterized protein LOC130797043 [Amaranthus tricolor]|uniref:uncharacterized protein LOC130797043 n=1 Tax=Amaranthus tricolor TaxID=29722 RepID=UPI00258FF223|nr:uncharacterized protein LOC130797043 [Amaranthus tricolor]
MENYPSYSYPDSGDSSPRSREIDFENPPPSWDEQSQQNPPQLSNQKVKVMVSYGGKIQPRSHDNLLSYVGGETKILAVDRNIKFSSFYAKLSSILYSDSNDSVSSFSFKYQLPGEDLDALISVTNDDDLENMMHEYDRLCRGSSKPARLRVFLFPVQKSSSFGSSASDKIERESDRFVDALNSASSLPPPQQQVSNNVDFLFGLEKPPVQIPISVPVQVQHEPDPQIDARIQELNRIQIRQKGDENPNMFTGPPANMPVPVQVPQGYWQPAPPVPHQQVQVHPEQQPPPPPPQNIPPQQNYQQFNQQNHQQQQQLPPPQQQQVYMVHAPPVQGVFHAPMMRPVSSQPGQAVGGGYYQMQQRVVPDQQVYREHPQQQQQQQPMYGVGPGKMGGYSDGMGVPVRAVASENAAYAQVAYDSGNGRQVFYPAQGGGVTAPFPGVTVSGSGEMRTVAAAESKIVQKVIGPNSSV